MTEREGTGTATVVGAGIAGLATAIGLRRAGWTVTVLERRTEPERYGDAAHAMTPNLGQGACTAILDAGALTRAVAAAPPGPAALAAALRAYDRERRRSAQRTAFASRTLHRLMSTERTWLRDAAVRLLPG